MCTKHDVPVTTKIYNHPKFISHLLHQAPISCGSRFHAGGPDSSGIIWIKDSRNFMEPENEVATHRPQSHFSSSVSISSTASMTRLW
ncbi:hypothetical protein DPMN_042947 [Dreissena polymorpha]|uniref:Uncharacterized protein n=1 Tax=Dreissena polymorpha TaxID=45954 RepID=A0A9D4D1Y1_DREPO|nr:hypothetical protein DPMN_042947 [Dreissena polymorpha]